MELPVAIKVQENPITRHRIQSRLQLPTGRTKKETKRKSKDVFRVQKPRRGKAEEFVGLKLVEWFLEHNMLEEARNLIEELKAEQA